MLLHNERFIENGKRFLLSMIKETRISGFQYTAYSALSRAFRVLGLF